MASIKAHVFNTVKEAEQAIELINKGEGIPFNSESITTTYCEYQEHNSVIFIMSDDITIKYLSKPTEINIKFEI